MRINYHSINHRTALIIPCYNEAARLDSGEYLKAIEEMPGLDLCFVDDGSSDGTSDLLRVLAAAAPERIKYLTLERNSGKSEAVRSGIVYMLEEVQELMHIGFWDADLATPLPELRRFMAIFESDSRRRFVFGSRKSEGGDIRRSFFRRFAAVVVGGLIKGVLPGKIKDSQCGAKIFTKKCAQKIFRDRFLTSWLFDVELFIRQRRDCVSMTEYQESIYE